MSCEHPNAQVKRYVGTTDTYNYCPDCWGTWGGEETAYKKRLIAGAAKAEDLGLVTEQKEVEGTL